MVSQPDHQSLAVRGPSSVVGVEGYRGGDRHEYYNHRDRDRHDRHGGGGGSSSRSSMSRSRRYNRSHAGGVSTVPLNEFPIFSHSGDVEIIVAVESGHENRYLLHRHTLTRCSGFFEASTSSEWSRAQKVPALSPLPTSPEGGAPLLAQGTELARVEREGRIGGGSSSGSSEQNGAVAGQQQQGGATRKRWRYELDLGAGPNDIPMLVQKEESKTPVTERLPPTNSLFGGGMGSSSTSSRKHASAAPPTSNHSFFRSVANLSLTHHRPQCSSSAIAAAPNLPAPSQAEQDILRDYDNLFRIMYNYPPLLDGINIADAYVQCKSLLALADQYDALPVVGPRVDHHLLQFQSRLWRQIAKYPISYLRLGYLARSRIIFQEALIHVVGQWPAGERSLRAALPPVVIDLIEDKADELEETVSRIESRLFRLGLTTRAGERVNPSTAYLDWLAISLFRQWLADNMSPPPQPPPPDRRTGGSSSSSSRDGHLTSRGRPSRDGGAHRGYDDNNHVTTVMLPPAAPPPLATLGRTYRTLGSTTSVAFLGHDECKRFLKLSGELYSRENLRRFERRVDELKAMAREVVRPLMGSGLELDVSAGAGGGSKGGDHSAVTYLTCIRLSDRDLPWDVDD
ncbi:hypothetical protein M0657_002884 [Pyricularia oryzae]|uniref:BTB domain-containing protein n=2 Tax=Pyricularia oryzae TaxID=318829 RepID=A0AA97PHP1_PYRO3|nr:hypothetical protein OOU_Y34scaffold00735g7 [Pyricularia oryzae Y34]KAI7928043.1 hypothetical protein M0657_002884 [Pyricularia oryzae]